MIQISLMFFQSPGVRPTNDIGLNSHDTGQGGTCSDGIGWGIGWHGMEWVGMG